MKQIVAAKLGDGVITNDIQKIVCAVENETLAEFYDRKIMRFMASCDVGRHYDELANAPTLFLIDEKGNYHWPSTSGTDL